MTICKFTQIKYRIQIGLSVFKYPVKLIIKPLPFFKFFLTKLSAHCGINLLAHSAPSDRRKRISIIRIIFSSWQFISLLFSSFCSRDLQSGGFHREKVWSVFNVFSKIIASKCFAYRESGSSGIGNIARRIIERTGGWCRHEGKKTIKYWNKIHLLTSETAATCFKSL